MQNNTQLNSLAEEVFQQSHKGLFTASEISNLLTESGKIANNDTSRKYILRKAIEKQFGYVQDIFAKALEHGTEFEPLAFNKFNDVYGERFITAERCKFMLIDENSGATPDGIVSDQSVLEIKCPYDGLNFFKLVQTGEIKSDYVYQMQMEMMAAKVEQAYFFNYCIINGVEYHHSIIVQADTKTQSTITEAIRLAAEQRDQIIYDLINKLQ